MLTESMDLLGLDLHSSMAALKASYRAKAQVSHPDHGGKDPDAFSQLVSAYKEVRDHFEAVGCPFCEHGKQTIQKGFTNLQIACEVCGGSGKRA